MKTYKNAQIKKSKSPAGVWMSIVSYTDKKGKEKTQVTKDTKAAKEFIDRL